MRQEKKQKKFSKLQHDDSYLKSLPKSSYYLIFDLQRQLAKHGHLKSHQDMEDFYRCIKFSGNHSELQKSLEDIRKRMLDQSRAADLKLAEKSCNTEDRGQEEHVSTSRFSQKVPDLEESLAELILCSNQEKDGCDPVFSKMKAPTFATLQPEFMRNFQREMPDLVIPEIPEKSERAEVYLRQLRQMHDLCLANMAFSRRLLERETDAPCWQAERGGDHELSLSGIDSKDGKMSQTNQPIICPPEQPSAQNGRLAFTKQLSRTFSVRGQKYPKLVRDKAGCRCNTPEPLSIEDLCQQNHMQIIDLELKLWRNYI